METFQQLKQNGIIGTEYILCVTSFYINLNSKLSRFSAFCKISKLYSIVTIDTILDDEKGIPFNEILEILEKALKTKDKNPEMIYTHLSTYHHMSKVDLKAFFGV